MQVVALDKDLNFIYTFGRSPPYDSGRMLYGAPGVFHHPVAIAAHGRELYVADRDNHRVQARAREASRPGLCP